MGAIPNKLPGFQDIERDHEARARFEQAWGTTIRPTLRLAPDPDVPRDGARRAADALRDRREPGAVRGRHQPHAQAPLRARLPRRPGHRPDEDGRDGRRRLPVGRVVVRDRRHRDEQRAARAARAQGARPARRGARRHVDHRRARPPARPRLARPGRRGRLGRAALALADARRDELRAARGARRPPVAVPRRDASRARRSCTSGCGPTRSSARRRRSRVVVAKGPFEELDDDYPIRLTTGRRLESYNTGAQTNLYSLAAPSRRVARPLARGRRAARARRRRDRARLVAARLGRGARAGSTRRCARASPS